MTFWRQFRVHRADASGYLFEIVKMGNFSCQRDVFIQPKVIERPL